MAAWTISTNFNRGRGTGNGTMSKGTFIFLCVFLTSFFVVGASFLVRGLQDVFMGDPSEGWPMAGFALLFLAFPSGFLALIIYGYRRARVQAAMAAENQDTPWLCREDWAKGVVRSGGRAVMIGLWVFAVVWNGISSPILFAFRQEWEKGNKAVLIGLLFPLVGIGVLIAAIRATLRWRRFGKCELRLDTLPGRIGGHFSAQLNIPSVVYTVQKVDLRMACIRRTTTGSGKNRSTHETLLWEEKRVAPRQVISFDKDGMNLPVFFRLPRGQPDSLAGNPAIIWRIEATADLPGIDFSEKFEVPVFTTEEAASDRPIEDPLAEHQDELDVGTAPTLRGIRIHETPSGVSIDFKPARHPVAIFGLLTFTLIWTGIMVALIKFGAPLLFPIVWGLFDLVLILGLITSIFHGVRIDASDGALTIRHRLIVPAVTRHAAAGTITAVEAAIGTRSGNTQYYRIVVRTNEGKRYHAGGGLKEKRDATWIAERLAIAAGL